jgi:ketosteroid isomerase-like protein
MRRQALVAGDVGLHLGEGLGAEDRAAGEASERGQWAPGRQRALDPCSGAAWAQNRFAGLRGSVGVHPNAETIRRFYACFAARDAEGMAGCYAPDVVFRDPVFGELRGQRAADMWRMLAGRAVDLKVEVSGVAADDARGRARWVATYRFGPRGRRVRNVIDARFGFRDGRIVRHEDSFDFWRWSAQALGLPGLWLGWTPMMQARVRREALAGLARFEQGRGA